MDDDSRASSVRTRMANGWTSAWPSASRRNDERYGQSSSLSLLNTRSRWTRCGSFGSVSPLIDYCRRPSPAEHIEAQRPQMAASAGMSVAAPFGVELRGDIAIFPVTAAPS